MALFRIQYLIKICTQEKCAIIFKCMRGRHRRDVFEGSMSSVIGPPGSDGPFVWISSEVAHVIGSALNKYVSNNRSVFQWLPRFSGTNENHWGEGRVAFQGRTQSAIEIQGWGQSGPTDRDGCSLWRVHMRHAATSAHAGLSNTIDQECCVRGDVCSLDQGDDARRRACGCCARVAEPAQRTQVRASAHQKWQATAPQEATGHWMHRSACLVSPRGFHLVLFGLKSQF